jgi:hypothetical protein
MLSQKRGVEMKLLVWDRGWNGATVVTTATPECFIEEWRKAEKCLQRQDVSGSRFKEIQA